MFSDSNRQHVIVIRQPSHPSALHFPFLSIESRARAIDLRQCEPAANNANSRSDYTPQTKKVNRKDRRKPKRVVVNPVLEIHASVAPNGTEATPPSLQPVSRAIFAADDTLECSWFLGFSGIVSRDEKERLTCGCEQLKIRIARGFRASFP